MAGPVVDAGVQLAGYALGTLPTAQVVGRLTGHDPSREGSGNPGASNVFRTAGRAAGAAVLLGDLAKGAAAAAIGLATGSRLVALGAGLAAVLGHVVPVTRLGHGGKGVATAAGVGAVLFPLVAVAAAAVWSLVVASTRVASLASLAALVTFLAAAVAAGTPGAELLLLAAVVAVVGVRHRANVARLLRGDEPMLRPGRP